MTAPAVRRHAATAETPQNCSGWAGLNDRSTRAETAPTWRQQNHRRVELEMLGAPAHGRPRSFARMACRRSASGSHPVGDGNNVADGGDGVGFDRRTR
jgi:hypothetical protein